jgi:polyhydroxybutyrate depolymerase
MESTSMNGRKRVLAIVLMLMALPVVVVVVEALFYSIRNRNNGSLVSSGRMREYLLYVPRSYDRSRPAPLVISMHGAGGWPVQQRDLSGWNRLADAHGFIVVYPSGTKGSGPRIWGVGRGPGLTMDVRFIADLIDSVSAEYNIDPSRIYANGFSNGGGMSFALSCTLSDRIAAVGMVGAALTLPWNWCTDRRAVPVVAFHGSADPFAPYSGGESVIFPRPFPDIPTWTVHWARRNGCRPNAVESPVVADVTRREYTNCADDAAVVLYTIQGGGHVWPGGGPLPEWFVGPDSRSIDATRQMWAFFREHRLRVPRSASAGK